MFDYCVTFANYQIVVGANDSDFAMWKAQASADRAGVVPGELRSMILLGDLPCNDVELMATETGNKVQSATLPADFVAERDDRIRRFTVAGKPNAIKHLTDNAWVAIVSDTPVTPDPSRHRGVKYTKAGLPSRNQRGLTLSGWYCSDSEKWHLEVRRFGAYSSLWAIDDTGYITGADDVDQELSDADLRVIRAWVDHEMDYVAEFVGKTGLTEGSEITR